MEILDPGRLDSYEAVIFQKAYTQKDIQLALELKERGARIIFDLCDNHFYRLRQSPEEASNLPCLETMVRMADLVTVSTQALSDVSPRKGAMVVDDAVDEFHDESWRSRFIRNFGVRHHRLSWRTRLVWFGNAGSESPAFGLIDLGAIIPALNRVNKASAISLTVISNSEPCCKRYTREAEFPVSFQKWHRETFRALFQQHQICVLPVRENPFTICKSNNRLLLSLLLGVPVVADRIPSYDEFSRWVPFSNWEKNLRQMIEDPSESRQKVNEAGQYIRQHYGPERVVRQWSEVFQRVWDGVTACMNHSTPHSSKPFSDAIR